MNSKRKIVIIYDFDGTFYSGKHIFDNVKSKVDENKRKFLAGLTDSEYNEFCKDFPAWLEKSSGSDIVDLIYICKEKFPNRNISTAEFWNWQQEDRYDIILDPNEFVSPEFVKNICESYPVYLVSNSSYSHLNYYLNKLNLKPEWFKEIISNKFEEFDRTKKHYYKRIMEQECCSPSDVFVFGDSDKNDLEPARLLNMNTYLIKTANDVEQTTKNVLKNKI